MMELRPYQKAAKSAILKEWENGAKNTLLVLATGCGKTIVFSEVAKIRAEQNKRVLVLAHRGELLDQAAQKIKMVTGLDSAYEKADQSALGTNLPITVGSVQSLSRKNRLEKYPEDYYSTIIVDEAHHCLAKTYMDILQHFKNANVLGVTATPDRGDKQNLGAIFDSQAYEYGMKQAINEHYLCPITAKLIPLQLDINKVKVTKGDFNAGELGNAIEPYLKQIAHEIAENYSNRKTLIFLPLVKTSKLMVSYLQECGLNAAEVNGETTDREEVLKAYAEGKIQVLCNSMLLTEGWDCPSVDCIVVLRPTKVRSLYQQMVGRGTRLYEGKKELLLLDFLWMSERHNLCHPSSLVARTDFEAAIMNNAINDSKDGVDILQAQQMAVKFLADMKEKELARQLKMMRGRKAKQVDPIQYYASIQDLDLLDYEPSFQWEKQKPTDKQCIAIENYGIDSALVRYKGEAKMILDQLIRRYQMGLTSPKQIRVLERFGFRHVGTWKFNEANELISKISSFGWTVPGHIDPETYVPDKVKL